MADRNLSQDDCYGSASNECSPGIAGQPLNEHPRLTRVLTAAAGLIPAAQVATLGGLGAVALAPEVEASIIQSPIAANLVVPANDVGIYINVVTGVANANNTLVPGWDLNLYGNNSLKWYLITYPGLVSYTSSGGRPDNLSFGTSVAASAYFAQLQDVMVGSNLGNWHLNATNYFGFKFVNEADSATHYAWGSMLLGSTIDTRSITGIWYNDVAGAAIAVGQTTDVPEPATIALLALGAGGLLALRRRRFH